MVTKWTVDAVFNGNTSSHLVVTFSITIQRYPSSLSFNGPMRSINIALDLWLVAGKRTRPAGLIFSALHFCT